MKLEWKEIALIIALAIGVYFIAYHGWLNFLMPGEKKLSKGARKKRALYIQQVAASSDPGSVPMPGGDDE